MVGDDALDRGDGDQLALVHQVLQQLGVVDDLVVAAELRVLVAERVEAVRAGGDDLLGRLRLLGRLVLVILAEGHVQRGHVLHAELLEQGLVAEAAGGVTGALLVAAHDRELHARDVQQLREGLGGLLGAVLQGAGAADPVQVLDLGEVLDVLADDRDLEVDLLGPLQALLLRQAPGVALLLQVLEHRARLGRERGLDHHLVAAHVDDVVDVLDVHRALLDAGAAGGAGPQDVRVDDAVLLGGADQRALGLGERGGGDAGQLLLGGFLLALHGLAAAGQQVRRLGVGVVPQGHDQQLRGERLAGVPGGALRLAAAALGAGGEVQQALPGELLDLGDAEDVVVAGVGEVDLLAARGHREQGAEGGLTGGVALEEDVRERQEAVPGHAHVSLQGDRDHPDEGGRDLQPGEEVGEVLERGDVHALQPGHHRVRDEERGLVAVDVVLGALQGVQHEDADADDEDDGLDEVRLAEVGAGEAGLAARAAGVAQLTDRDQDEDADDRHRADELDVDVVRRPLADDRQDPVRLEQLADRVDDRQQQGEEAHRDEPVRHTDDAPAVHPGVAEELPDHGEGALRGVVGPRSGRHRLAEAHEVEDLEEGAAEQCHADHDQDQRHDDRGELHWGS